LKHVKHLRHLVDGLCLLAAMVLVYPVVVYFNKKIGRK